MNEYRIIISWKNRKNAAITYPVIVVAADAKSAAEYALERDQALTSKKLKIESVAIRKGYHVWEEINY